MMDKLTIFIIHPSDLLTDHQPYGEGRIVHEWLRLLAAAGHRIHVVAVRTALATEFPPNVVVHQIDVPPSALHTERLAFALKMRAVFRRISATEHIDLAHQFNPVVIGLSLGLIGMRVPIVLGSYFPRWPELNRRTLRLRLTVAVKTLIAFVQQRFARKILLSTPAAYEAIPLAGTLRGRFVPMPQPIDIDFFRPLPRRDDGPPRILFLANIMQRKGAFTLLDAFERVAAELPAAELVYAGGGFDSDLLRARVAALPAQQRARIRIVGNVDRAEIPQLMADASVYCLPSHGEPYGMSALEAMACAKPIVVTNVGGLSHLVPDGGALKVPPHDVAALATALLAVLRSPELQQRLGAVNRAVVEERHAPERALARLEAAYRSVTVSAPRAAAVRPEIRSQGSHG